MRAYRHARTLCAISPTQRSCAGIRDGTHSELGAPAKGGADEVRGAKLLARSH